MKIAIVALAVLLLTISAGAIESKTTHVYLGADLGTPSSGEYDSWNMADTLKSKQTHLYLGVGLGFPTGKVGDGWNLGFHGQAGFGIAVGSRIEIIPTIGYHSFAMDRQGYPISGGALSVLMLGVDCKISFPEPEQNKVLFILGGLGLGNASVNDITILGVTDTVGGETTMYYNFGVGIDFKTSPKVVVSLQGRFVSVMTSGSATTFIPITVGLRF